VVAALGTGRNCVAVEKDMRQVLYTMRRLQTAYPDTVDDYLPIDYNAPFTSGNPSTGIQHRIFLLILTADF